MYLFAMDMEAGLVFRNRHGKYSFVVCHSALPFPILLILLSWSKIAIVAGKWAVSFYGQQW